jgi:tetratricopeptide (TPR) repeat protein
MTKPPSKRKSTPRRSGSKAETQPETRINLQGSDNAVATGKSIAANIKIIFQGGWKPFAVVLLLVAVLLFVILWNVLPHKDKAMKEQFNVAVAQFLVQDASRKTISSQDGSLLASYVSQEIQTQFAAMDLDNSISNDVWGPEETGVVQGNTSEQRTEAAKKLAEKINAYVLIYGIIVEDGDRSKFLPEFYINHKSFVEASEITGGHELGHQLALSLPFHGIQNAENPALAGRIRALDLITIGLAYYSADKFDEALTYFQRAADEKDWIGAGREIVYLLIGNTYVRKDSQAHDFADVPRAMQNYQFALQINPEYSRAMVGKAGVLYLQASQDLTKCDPTGLEQASNLLTQALALKNQPASANIETKVHFYRGQIAIIRDGCHLTGQDWLSSAQKEFSWVTNLYESRKEKSNDYQGIESLASHSYARLGYIAYQRGDTEKAISWFQKAVDIASPYYQGYYRSFMGDIFAATGHKAEALESYNEAIAIAEMKADADSMKSYQEKLQAAEKLP